jgi:ABC-type multidrug transport system fused ATPase/permease subunit
VNVWAGQQAWTPARSQDRRFRLLRYAQYDYQWDNNMKKLSYLLKPHWHQLTLAFVAVIGESVTDLLEPWPLKIVFDNVLGSKRLPDWLARLVHSTAGTSKLAILSFVVVVVLIIATVGAISTYFEKYLTTSVAQWVSHDLRRTLYNHIQKLSLSFHDNKRTGDLISRITSDIDSIQDFISQVLLGLVVNVLTLAGMLAVMFYLNWTFTLIALSGRTFFIHRRLQLHLANQKSFARREEERRRDCVNRERGTFIDSRRQGFH